MSNHRTTTHHLIITVLCVQWLAAGLTNAAAAAFVLPSSNGGHKHHTTTAHDPFIAPGGGGGGGGGGVKVSLLRCYETPPPKRSVSDYMGGHHAGKFDFDPRICGVTALNYEKSVIFDDSFTTEAAKTKRIAPPPETVPSWALRNKSGSDKDPILADIRLGQAVTIQNEELTWEPFYATISPGEDIENLTETSIMRMSITPSSGTLAPRGGRNDFDDSCVLRVVINPGQQRQEQESAPPLNTDNYYQEEDPVGGGDVLLTGEDDDNNKEMFLVVRTETERWRWRIISVP